MRRGSNGDRAAITVQKGVTQPVFSYAEAIRETVYVQTTIDGDQDTELDLIATDIIRPKESDGDLKVPVIFEQSPYYQDQGRGNEAEVKMQEDGDFSPAFFPLFYDNYFVPRGYAFIAQDMPGTRNSEGCMVLGADDEELAAKATIDWLNGRGKAFTAAGEEVPADWSTGQVGMIGKSYDASVANGTATTGVEGLETIVPIGGHRSLVRLPPQQRRAVRQRLHDPRSFRVRYRPAPRRRRGTWAGMGREHVHREQHLLGQRAARSPRARRTPEAITTSSGTSATT